MEQATVVHTLIRLFSITILREIRCQWCQEGLRKHLQQTLIWQKVSVIIMTTNLYTCKEKKYTMMKWIYTLKHWIFVLPNKSPINLVQLSVFTMPSKCIPEISLSPSVVETQTWQRKAKIWQPQPDKYRIPCSRTHHKWLLGAFCTMIQAFIIYQLSVKTNSMSALCTTPIKQQTSKL